MILVTGGAGYIGSHFVKAWLAKNRGERILVVDNLSEGHREALNFSNRIIFVQEDIGNLEAMRALLLEHQVEAVVHFAASISVGESQQYPHKYTLNNVAKSLELFSAMQDAGVKKIIFSSSCATYGNPKYLPLDENHPQDPSSVYGLTKFLIEKTLESYCQTAGWKATGLRYFNAAGADDSGLIGESHNDETHLIPLILQVASGRRQQVNIYGNDYYTPDGTCIRDYVHVNDLAEAHISALKLLNVQGRWETFNLGSTFGNSVNQIIELCQKITGRRIVTQMFPRRSGDVPVLLATTDKAESYLNWKPKYSLQRIIETAWQWEQNRQYGKLASVSEVIQPASLPTNVVSMLDHTSLRS